MILNTKQPATKPKLSIIIVNWNTEKLLKQCLNSLVQSSKLKVQSYGIEIIVVDNGSTDGSINEIQKSKFKYQNQNLKFIIILNKENLGFGRANNQGIKVASGEYIMLLNSDTIVKPEALSELIKYLEQHPNVAVSPQLLLPNGQLQNEANFKFPNIWQIIIYHNPVFRYLFKHRKYAQRLMFNNSDKGVYEVDHFPMVAVVASKETWEKVGGLDESYKFFFEDVDWSWRAKHKGIKRVVVSDAEIIHYGGASWKQKLKENKTLIYRQNFSSMLFFCKKNYPYVNYQSMRWAVIVNMIITLKLSLAWYFIKTPTKQTDLW